MSLFGNVASMTKSLVVSLCLSLESYFVQMRSCVRCGKVDLLGGPKCSAGVFIWKKGSSPPPDASPVTSAQREHPNMGSMARKKKLENVFWVWPSIKMVRSLGMH